MNHSQPAPTTTRQIPRLLIGGLLIVSAGLGASLGYQMQAPASLAAAAPIDASRRDHRGAAPAPIPDVSQASELRDRGLALVRGLGRFRQPPGQPPLDPPGASGRPPRATTPGQPRADAPGRPDDAAPNQAPRPTQPEHAAPAKADGVLPPGTSVFDDDLPGVARLNPALRAVLRRATTDASDDGVELSVTSGWRSPAYQHRLRTTPSRSRC